MKQSRRTLILLLAVLLILAAVCAVLLLRGKAQGDADQPSGQTMTVLYECESTQITGFVLESSAGKSDFALTDDGWRYHDDQYFPLNKDFVNNALETLSRISAVRRVTADAQDLSPYGLDNPKMRVQITADGSTVFLIGDYNSFAGYYYLCREGERDVYLVDLDLVQLCSSEQKKMLTLDVLPDSYADAQITAVTLTGAQGERRLTESDEVFTELSDQLSKLSLADYADYYFAQDERAEHGFDAPTRVKIDYAANKTDSADGSSSVSATVAYEYTITVGAPDADYLCFMIEDSDILYRMKRVDLSALCGLIG